MYTPECSKFTTWHDLWLTLQINIHVLMCNTNCIFSKGMKWLHTWKTSCRKWKPRQAWKENTSRKMQRYYKIRFAHCCRQVVLLMISVIHPFFLFTCWRKHAYVTLCVCTSNIVVSFYVWLPWYIVDLEPLPYFQPYACSISTHALLAVLLVLQDAAHVHLFLNALFNHSILWWVRIRKKKMK